MSAYLNLPQPEITEVDLEAVHLSQGGVAVVELSSLLAPHLSMHVEDAGTARQLAAAFTKAAELLEQPGESSA